MITITVWLLMNIGSPLQSQSNASVSTIEKFTTVVECERVVKILRNSRSYPFQQNQIQCIQATIVK